jgi:Uma2 family endonuclease
MAPAGNRHGYVAGEIFGELRSHVKANKLGRTNVAETGFKVGSDPDTVLAPDVAFVRRERLGSTRELEGYWSGAPDLVVEVVSPKDRHSEDLDKPLSWLQAGCRMVLVADPKRRITTVYRSREDIRVLTAEAGDLVDGAGVVPGWRLSLADIFAWE